MSGAKDERVDLATEWRSMQRRMVDHMKSGQRSDFAEKFRSVDASVYTDSERCDAERERVFRALPILVGFSGEVAEAGDRLLFDEAGVPIVVVRANDGALRAFLNLCTHRGSRLVTDCTRSKKWMCPFHGWVFDLEGRLDATPLPDSFEGLDRDQYRLIPVPVAEWEGMIFVRASTSDASSGGPLDASDDLDIEAFLGPMAPLLRALDLGSLERVASTRMEVDTNWKLALDTFCEVYHVPVVHKDSLALNLYPNVAIFDSYGLHHRYSGAGRDFEALLDQPESEWPPMSYQAVHYLFPNTTFAFTHSLDGKTPVVSMFRLFPGESVGKAITLATTYKRADETGVSAEAVAEMHATVLEIVGAEDYRIAADGWRNLEAAPPGFKVAFGRSEAILQRYHTDLARITDCPLDEQIHQA